MGVFREIPPTAGLPVYAKELLRAFSADGGADCLESDFKRYLSVRYSRITSSGTAAFYLILEAIKSLSGRRTVIIPSYVCPLLPLAIKRAGLKVAVCDIAGGSFDFDKEELERICAESSDILAIVAVHLAGVPVDFDTISEVAERHSVFTIEDCAQSLGAGYKGKKTGTLADFSFFSLCRGKGVTIYEGGAVVVNRPEYEAVIEEAAGRLFTDGVIDDWKMRILLFGYWIFYRPLLFWFVFRLPQKYWNLRGDRIRAAQEDFSMDFPVHGVSPGRKRIGHAAFHRIDDAIEGQRRKAAYLIKGLEKAKGIKVITEAPGCRATYPYLTLIYDDKDRRDRALTAVESGMGGSIIYALAVTDYGYLGGIVPQGNPANGRHMARNSLTLSTSVFLNDNDMDSVIGIIEKT